MPKYLVKNTQIKHGGETGVVICAPGDVLELTLAEAESAGENVEPVVERRVRRKREESESAELLLLTTEESNAIQHDE